MTRLSAAYGRFLDNLAAIAALILFAMVIVVSADIGLRSLTRNGIPWANEVSEYALYVMTLLAAPWLLRRGQHVRIDLVLTHVPARSQKRRAWSAHSCSAVRRSGCERSSSRRSSSSEARLLVTAQTSLSQTCRPSVQQGARSSWNECR